MARESYSTINGRIRSADSAMREAAKALALQVGGQRITAAIAAAGTTSAAVDAGGGEIVRIETDAAIVGTALTFQVSTDGLTYLPLYDASGAVSVTVSTSRAVSLAAGRLRGIDFIKAVSGSTETAGTVVTLVIR